MLNIIWLGMILLSLVFGIINGTLPDVVNAVTDSAQQAITVSLGLLGIMVFWLGLMKIAEKSGLIKTISHIISPLLRRLFPDIPKDHESFGHITLNLAANMLGLANAATPFGIRAMEALQTLNKDNPSRASHAMCMFLAINTSSVQLIPATGIAFLAANGAHSPTDIIATAFLATLCSSIVGISGALIARNLSNRKDLGNAS